MRTNNRTFGFFNSTNTLAGIIALGLLLVVLFYVAKFAFRLLYLAAPFLLIITLLINYRIVVEYGKSLIENVRRNPLLGILGIIFTFFAYPVVIFMLFGKAMLYRKVNKMQQQYVAQRETQYRDEFVEYEEIKEPPMPLPPLQRQPRAETPSPAQRPNNTAPNQYDQLFE